MQPDGSRNGALNGKVLFVQAERGIGLAIARRLRGRGASQLPQPPRHPSCRDNHTAAEIVSQAGGIAICDIRFTDQIDAAVARTVAAFGESTFASTMRRRQSNTCRKRRSVFDLMNQINYRALALAAACRTCWPDAAYPESRPPSVSHPPSSVAYGVHDRQVQQILHRPGTGGRVPRPVAVNATWPRTIGTAIRNWRRGLDQALP